MNRRGFLAGCFDPFPHPGYILAMREVIENNRCDTIIIGLHINPIEERPTKSPVYCSPKERRTMLEAIRYVSHIVNYNSEEQLYNLLKNLKPELRILGEDYQNKPYTGDDLNIPVYYTSRQHNYSATQFRDRIKNNEYWSPGTE